MTVRIHHPDSGFDATERVTANAEELRNSKAMKFAPKNKLRFHGVRVFVSFHLAHLFLSVQDEFTQAFHEAEQQGLLEPKISTGQIGMIEDMVDQIPDISRKEAFAILGNVEGMNMDEASELISELKNRIPVNDPRKQFKAHLEEGKPL